MHATIIIFTDQMYTRCIIYYKINITNLQWVLWQNWKKL